MTTPLEYQLYSPKTSLCDWCGKKSGERSELQFQDRVQVENDLSGIDRKQSRCSSQKYQPPTPLVSEFDPKMQWVPARVCERDVVWTNLTKPSDTGLPELKVPEMCSK